MWLLILALLAPAGPARADEVVGNSRVASGAPLTDLTDVEKFGSPAWLYHDYLADRARTPEAKLTALVERYRRIIQAMDRLSKEDRRAFLNRIAAAASRQQRDALVLQYTGVGTGEVAHVVDIGNDDAGLTLRMPRWQPSPEASVDGRMKFGMLAPFGGTGDQNSTLRESPYFHAAVEGAYDGAMTALMTVSGSMIGLQSGKAVYDPAGKAVSNASDAPHDQSRFTQLLGMGSAYADAGKIFSFGSSVKGAVFAAFDGIFFTPLNAGKNPNPAVPIVAANAGTLWVVRSEGNQATAFADVSLQGVSQDIRTYGNYTVSPSGRAGLEYARLTGPGQRVAVGAEGSLQPADVGVRPYASIMTRDATATVAGNFRASRDPLAPNVAGGGAQVEWQASPVVKVGVQGSLSREQFDMAPGPELGYTAMTTVGFDFDRVLKVNTAIRAPERYFTPPVAADQSALDENIRGSQYAGTFKQALHESSNMSEFAAKIGAKDEKAVLAALAAFSANLSKWNYDGSDSGWAGTDQEMFANAQRSIESHTKIPDLQCPGGATFAAGLAEELGRQAGIPIHAWAAQVSVTDNNGAAAQHYVALIKTPSYGFVIDDWGQLTPTFSYKPERALDIYQAVQGVPELSHFIADSKGHFVDYLFSTDGKVIIEKATFHAEHPGSPLNAIFRDNPNKETPSITEGRFKDAIEQRFDADGNGPARPDSP